MKEFMFIFRGGNRAAAENRRARPDESSCADGNSRKKNNPASENVLAGRQAEMMIHVWKLPQKSVTNQ